MTTQTKPKKELKTEVIAFRVTASFKAALENEAAKDKRQLKDFIHLKLEECASIM